MQKKAFTLMEIMLVIIIIGVLVAIVMPRLVGRSEQARVSACKADIANITLAIDLFEMDNGRLPSGQEGLGSLRTNPGQLPNWKGTYLKKEPKDPWGKAYIYKIPASHGDSDYDLYSAGPDGTEGNSDDIGNW